MTQSPEGQKLLLLRYEIKSLIYDVKLGVREAK